MGIDIKIVGPLRFVIGPTLIYELDEATIGDIIKYLKELYEEKRGVGRPPFEEILGQLTILVNGEKVSNASRRVSKDDEIKIVQPVHGG